MTRKMVALGAAIFFTAFPTLVAAQSVLTKPVVPDNCRGADAAAKCGVCDLAQLAQNVLNLGIYIAVFMSAILLAWAGWKYLTAGGGEGVGEARSMITNVILGLVIILAGWLVVDTLMKTFTKGSFGPWNQVCRTSASPMSHFYA